MRERSFFADEVRAIEKSVCVCVCERERETFFVYEYRRIEGA
jgi:hypothetical protein